MAPRAEGFWRRPYSWIGFALSAACILLVVWKTDFAEVWNTLRGANYAWVALAVVNVVVILALKAARWRLLFYPNHRSVDYGTLWGPLVVGVFINFVLPVRAGEIVRGYLVGAKRGNVAHVLGTITVEKLVDMIALAVLLLILVPVIAVPAWLLRPAWVVGGVALVLLACFALVRGRVVLLVHWAEERIPWVRRWSLADRVRRGLDGMEPLLHRSPLLRLWGWTVIIWGVSALTNHLMFRAMHLDLSIGAAFLLLAALQASFALPSSPGRLGVYHYICVLILSFLGVARDPALSYAVLLYVVTNGPPALLGVFLLWKQGYDLTIIRQAYRRGRERPTA